MNFMTLMSLVGTLSRKPSQPTGRPQYRPVKGSGEWVPAVLGIGGMVFVVGGVMLLKVLICGSLL